MNPGTIIIVVGLIVIIVTLLIAIFNAQYILDAFPVPLSGSCRATGDCATGLTCQDGVCLVPPGGSCSYSPNFCAFDGICAEGLCVARHPTPNGDISSRQVPRWDLRVPPPPRREERDCHESRSPSEEGEEEDSSRSSGDCHESRSPEEGEEEDSPHSKECESRSGRSWRHHDDRFIDSSGVNVSPLPDVPE